MEIILYIIGALVSLGVIIGLYKLLSNLIYRYPWIAFIIGLAGGLFIGFASSIWWIGVIVGLILGGILFPRTRCSQCGSTVETEVKVTLTTYNDGSKHKVHICEKCNPYAYCPRCGSSNTRIATDDFASGDNIVWIVCMDCMTGNEK